MIFRTATILLAIAPTLLACVAVDGDRILASHLAAANQKFREIESRTVVGLAPRPGITRVIRGTELKALASRHHLQLAGLPADICFVRGTAPDDSGAEPGHVSATQSGAGISRGQRVSVEVQSGAAQIRFETSAESSGRTGDSVLVRNPSNGRLFQAKVASSGKVVVQR